MIVIFCDIFFVSFCDCITTREGYEAIDAQHAYIFAVIFILDIMFYNFRFIDIIVLLLLYVCEYLV